MSLPAASRIVSSPSFAVDDVVPCSACQAVVAEASEDRVVAAGTVDDVVLRPSREVVRVPAPNQGVSPGTSDGVLDVGRDVVSLPGLAVIEDAVQRHHHAVRASRVGHEVDSAAPRHRVRAVRGGPLVEDVVAEPARQRVASRPTRDRVVARAARDRVVGGPAREHIVARAAANRVVTGAASDSVVAAVAVQRHREQGRPTRARVPRTRNRIGPVARVHGRELNARERDVCVVVPVQIRSGRPEDDVVGLRAPGDDGAVLHSRREVDDELDFGDAGPFRGRTRRERATAQVDGDGLGPGRPVDDDGIGRHRRGCAARSRADHDPPCVRPCSDRDGRRVTRSAHGHGRRSRRERTADSSKRRRRCREDDDDERRQDDPARTQRTQPTRPPCLQNEPPHRAYSPELRYEDRDFLHPATVGLKRASILRDAIGAEQARSSTRIREDRGLHGCLLDGANAGAPHQKPANETFEAVSKSR